MKNILLIGGSYGIGQSIIATLKDTHHLFVASRTNENLHHKNITHIPFDVTVDELDVDILPKKLDGFVSKDLQQPWLMVLQQKVFL